MKKYIYNLMAACTVLLAFASCSEDENLTTLANVTYPSALTATPDAVVLNSTNKYLTVTTISWPAVAFPVDAPVTYSLQFTTVGDVDWEHPLRMAVGEDVLSKSLLGAELNSMAIAFGLPVDIAGQIMVRGEAFLDRSIYSEPIALTVTPFIEVITVTEIYMFGSFQGSNPADGAPLTAIDSGVFQGLVTLPAGQLDFKFTSGEPGQIYGADGSGNFTDGGTGSFSVAAAGSYQVTVNLNTMSYTAVPYSFGVIGTATPGGWDNDTNMAYDYQNQRWTYTGNLVPGALKFRLNDSWTVNYGMNNNDDGIAYYDNQGAHTITEAGNYTVTFKVNPDPATAVYTVTMN